MDQFRRSKSRRRIVTRARQGLGLVIAVLLVAAMTIVMNMPVHAAVPLSDILRWGLIGAGYGVVLLVVIFVLFRILSRAAQRR